MSAAPDYTITVDFADEKDAHDELWYDEAAWAVARQITEWGAYLDCTFEFANSVTGAKVRMLNSFGEDGTAALRIVQ